MRLGDDGRVNKLRTIASNLAFVDDLQCQVGVLVLLRRIAGGINASEQQIALSQSSPVVPVTRRSGSTGNSSTKSGACLQALSNC